MLRTTTATRYVTPLREGGSLPAIVAGEIARTLGLAVPEIVFMELDPLLGRSEPDFEIQDLIKASAGLNLALDFLPGALTFDALDVTMLEPLLASSILWFDAYVTNVDRTARNTNMLWWHRRLMLIDHGASLYFHHVNADYLERSRTPFATIKNHVLLPMASALTEADQRLKMQLTPEVLQNIVSLIPSSWLENDPDFADPEAQRAAYLDYLLDRLAHSHIFVEEAIRARDQLL
jgi:hypothetical protein